MTVTDVYTWLDSFAPFAAQDEDDNTGLLAGDPAAQVRKVLFALDATLETVAQAVREGATLIVTHHPLMYRPIQKLRFDQGEGAVLKALAAGDISLLTAHTNLDRCAGGVADALAQALGLTNVTASDACPYLRTGELAQPVTAGAFLEHVNRSLRAHALLYADPDRKVRRIAVIPGAGGSELQSVHDADLALTGEVKHHELLGAHARGLAVIGAGHFHTEFPGVTALYRRFLQDASNNRWNAEAALMQTPPYPCRAHG